MLSSYGKVLFLLILTMLHTSCLDSDAQFNGNVEDVEEEEPQAVEATGSITVPDTFEAEQSTEYHEHFDLCTDLEKNVKTDVLQFPATEACAFGVGDNLEAKESFLQAIVSQNAEINLEGNTTVLCELKMTTVSPELQYDDFILLTMNDRVLMSSNVEILNLLDFDSSYKWDFMKARGNFIEFSGPAYCLGNELSLCEVPETDTFGNLKLDFSAQVMTGLAKSMELGNTLRFQLISTGDNDPDDCLHSDFSLSYELKYVSY